MSLPLETASAPWSSSCVWPSVARVSTAQVWVEILSDVFAPTLASGNRRTGVENSSEQYGGMGRKECLDRRQENSFEQYGGMGRKECLDRRQDWKSVAKCRVQAECTREYVLRLFWQSFVEDKFDLENAIQKPSSLMPSQ